MTEAVKTSVPPKPKPAARVSPSRWAAFEILLAAEREQSYASVLLASPRYDRLSALDRGLAGELTLGTLRWQGQLDWLIAQCSDRNVASLDAEVRVAIRIALYQIVHLGRIPPRAAVSEAVETVRAARKKSAAGLVNAVLRRALQHAPAMLETLASRDDPASLSVSLSHPQWLIEKWTEDFGRDETMRLALANNERPTEGLRFNPFVAEPAETLRQLLAAGVTLSPSAVAKGAYRADAGSADALRAALAEGSIAIQDESSQLVAELADAKPGQWVLDLCAAPGGKTAVVAASMRGEGFIVAGDIHLHRLRTTRTLLDRQKIPMVSLVAWDARDHLPLVETASFSRVLVDVPCSGTGTLRRNPEIKWRLAAERIADLAGFQLKLLHEGSRWLCPGGMLVYSTCSLEKEENERVIENFLRTTRDYKLLPIASEGLRPSDSGVLRTFPHRENTDGFFAAVLIRS